MFIYVYVSVSVYNFNVVKVYKLLILMWWFSSGMYLEVVKLI